MFDNSRPDRDPDLEQAPLIPQQDPCQSRNATTTVHSHKQQQQHHKQRCGLHIVLLSVFLLLLFLGRDIWPAPFSRTTTNSPHNNNINNNNNNNQPTASPFRRSASVATRECSLHYTYHDLFFARPYWYPYAGPPPARASPPSRAPLIPNPHQGRTKAEPVSEEFPFSWSCDEPGNSSECDPVTQSFAASVSEDSVCKNVVRPKVAVPSCLPSEASMTSMALNISVPVPVSVPRCVPVPVCSIPCSPLADTGSYVTFPISVFQFNNQRQAFLLAVFLAALTNRTLLLPVRGSQIWGVDVYDMSVLSGAVPVRVSDVDSSGPATFGGVSGVSSSSVVNLDLDAVLGLLYWSRPSVNDSAAWSSIRAAETELEQAQAKKQGGHGNPKFKTKFIQTIQEQYQHTTVWNVGAYWGSIEFLAKTPTHVYSWWYSIERNYLHYHPSLWAIADRVLHQVDSIIHNQQQPQQAVPSPSPSSSSSSSSVPVLPLFVCVHWRQQDFFKDYILTVDGILSQLSDLRRRDPRVGRDINTLYIATDDSSSAATKELIRVLLSSWSWGSSSRSSNSSVVSRVGMWSSVLSWYVVVQQLRAGEFGSWKENFGTQQKYRTGVVEQIACAHAQHIITTPLSSWSGGVLSLRRFMPHASSVFQSEWTDYYRRSFYDWGDHAPPFRY